MSERNVVSDSTSLRRRALLAATAGSMATLAGCFAETEYTIADVEMDDVTDEPFSFDINVLDPDIQVNSPGKFELAVTNNSDMELQLVSFGVRPYGMLEMNYSEIDGSSILLWNDDYEKSEYVRFAENGVLVRGEELITYLDNGETIQYSFEIRGEETNFDGEYTISNQSADGVLYYRYEDDKVSEQTDTTEDESDLRVSDPSIVFDIEKKPRFVFI